MRTTRGVRATGDAGVALLENDPTVRNLSDSVAVVEHPPAVSLMPAVEAAERVAEPLPGKRPLIRLSAEPPNYESPVEYLSSAITDNDAFFVRYNRRDVPRLDAITWTLSVGGDGARTGVTLRLDDLRRLPAFEVVAVCQCSGNGRSLFDPPAPGVPWGNGAVGCARWTGARLADVLALAGLRDGALEVILAGADKGGSDTAPDFAKSLPLWKAREDTVLVAYEMNGRPLPHLHGAPARIVVPGWTATYWVKHVEAITIATEPFDCYWMRSTYRVPRRAFPAAPFSSQETEHDAPITEMLVNALITAPHPGAIVRASSEVEIAGIAWDGGHGIGHVDVSCDEGRTWMAASLDDAPGRYAFHPWRARIHLAQSGRHVIMARATNRAGRTQPAQPIANPSGYHHNAMPRLTLMAR